MLRFAFSTLSLTFLAALFVGLYMHYRLQDLLFAGKDVAPVAPPAGIEYQEIQFLNPKEKLYGWIVPAPAPSRRWLLYFADGRHSFMHPETYRRLSIWRKLSFNVLVFDYNGYGLSEGEPSEAAFYEAARQAYYFLLNNTDAQAPQIVLYGEGIGASVALQLSAQGMAAGALILDNPIYSIKQLIDDLHPFMPTGLYGKFRKGGVPFNSAHYLNRSSTPKLFLVCEGHLHVPAWHGLQLYEENMGPGHKLHRFPGDEASMLEQHAATYQRVISRFLDNLQL
ncbi:MAG: hypothetical protein KatS3mg033_0508 [Thermonema sp.]|uniref:alpha/beta hydrolase n=1 Tax=Thermonema sp. TaxID=2231181 RepID=UPI0021DE0D79|nr:alpha/beta hydrolase [Thermonema sp.]GIV38708.1 MAG: hypothetical protein KatS3mg033_0508 [Thermonema sp.]